jgi:ABC-2 type transport system permease protein
MQHDLIAHRVVFRGADLEIVWPQYLALFGIGTVFFAVAFWRFRTVLK